MDLSGVNFIYGVLAIVGIVTLIWLGVMVLVSRFSEAAHFGFEGLRERATPYAIVLAWIPALLAMVGSLYYSEVAHLLPCPLCWFQRIAMYPLVLLLGIAAYRRDIGIRIYAIPLAAIGAAISVYHLLLEWHIVELSLVCSVDNPCSSALFRQFGFISMPFLALIAFLLVIAFLLLAHRGADEADDEAVDSED